MLLLPFSASILEVVFRKDAKPVYINLDYTREPDYFGKSFMTVLKKALNSLNMNIEEIFSCCYVSLSMPRGKEWINFTTPDFLSEKEVLAVTVFLSDTHLNTEKTFKKEVVVLGDFLLTENCTMRSLYVRGDCIIKSCLRVERWLHIEGNLEVNSFTTLGCSSYVKGDAVIKGSVAFKRFYAKRISTFTCEQKESGSEKNSVNIKGPLKTKWPLIIDGTKRSICIDGDLFSEGDVEIQGNVHVKGCVFSQGNVVLKHGVRIGDKDRIKSVVAKEKIIIKGAFEIYGYLHAENGGIIEL